MARRQQPPQPDFAGYLTRDDVKVLKSLVHDVKNLKINSQLRTDENWDHQAPETYEAITLEAIPALTNVSSTGTGSGTAAEGDLAGSGDCLLLRIMQSDSTLDRLPRRETVYNISTSAIPANTVIIVSRDKFGKWLAFVGGSGGGGQRIRFTVVDKIGDDPGVCACYIESHSCNTSLSGIVIVYDFAGCFFNEPGSHLIGRQGFADYMKETTIATGTSTIAGTGTFFNSCHWEVSDLCCP